MSTTERSRRKRGSLSRDEIVAGALAILDRDGDAGLTFNRLGDELQCSPTAVYRHFTGRDDLILAIGDALDAESLATYEPTDHWRADLTTIAWSVWRTALAHPAAAAVSFNRVTYGMNEFRGVDFVLRALHHAGLTGPAAVFRYQVLADMVLGTASGQGERLAAAAFGPELVRFYAPADPNAFPYAEAVRAQLRPVDYERIFAKQLEMYLDTLERELAVSLPGSNEGVAG